MDTMSCVLCFLDELDFTDRLNNDCLEKLDIVKRLLVGDFEDCNTPKMIYALNIVDEIKLSDMTNVLDYHLERTDSIRSVSFCLFSF